MSPTPDDRELWLGLRRVMIALIRLIEARYPSARPFEEHS